MNYLLHLATFLVAFLPILGLVCGATDHLRRPRHRIVIWCMWRRCTPPMFLEVAILVACVIGTFSALYAYVPFMKWSILYLFDVSAAPLSLLEMSWNWGYRYEGRLYVTVLLLCILPFVPYLTSLEERMCRKGYEKWHTIAFQSCKFGLAHCAVPIMPIAGGFTLILVGLFLGWKYFRAFRKYKSMGVASRARVMATRKSATYHALYDGILIIVLILFVQIM